MSVEQNLKDISLQIEKSCKRFQRNTADVTLVAVSKRQPIERIKESLSLGQRCFGENIIQDAQKTWLDSGLQEEYNDIDLRLIGSLQTNKAKDAVALFDCIETIDRPKLVDALQKEEISQGKTLEHFIQVNTGDEDQKSGVSVSDLPALLDYCKGLNFKISGLMCIPPVNEPSALHFAFLKLLAQRHNIANLSMGMSNDFEKAIHLNATHIRVGSALFGQRST